MLHFLSFFDGARFRLYEGEGQDKPLRTRADLEKAFATLKGTSANKPLHNDPNLALRESHDAAREGFERYQNGIIKPRKS